MATTRLAARPLERELQVQLAEQISAVGYRVRGDPYRVYPPDEPDYVFEVLFRGNSATDALGAPPGLFTAIIDGDKVTVTPGW